MRAIVLVLCLAAAGAIAAYTQYWSDPNAGHAGVNAPVYTVNLPSSEEIAPSAPAATSPKAPEATSPEAADAPPETPADAGPEAAAASPPEAPVPAIDTRRIAPDDRVALARALQRELKRVGCYQGQITGVWAGSSRAAMKAFVDRVNATLPTDNPDPVLLSLVEGHRKPVCGAACPKGQTAARNGACMPDAVVAKVKEPQDTATQGEKPDGWSAAVSGPVPPEGMVRRRPQPQRRAAQEPQPPKVIRDIFKALGLD